MKAVATKEKAQHVDLLRRAAEERANLIDGSLKSAQKEISKLKAELEVERMVKELTAVDAAKAFAAGELKAKELYTDKAMKFENRGFKHGWFKALAAANVTLDQLIPYEQLEAEPLESDPEEFDF